ncbi:MAG: hypothetical protein PVSMB10_16910 [Pseudarthrobacter sp.]
MNSSDPNATSALPLTQSKPLCPSAAAERRPHVTTESRLLAAATAAAVLLSGLNALVQISKAALECDQLGIGQRQRVNCIELHRFGHSLHHQEAIKRVSVVQRQIRNLGGGAHGQF